MTLTTRAKTALSTRAFTKFVLLIAIIAFSNSTVFCQAPASMGYQSVIRDATDALLVNQSVGVQISIIQTSPVGPVVYLETHNPTTNANGLISLEIGNGTPIAGSVSSINWYAGPYYIQTETDPLGGTSYTLTTTTQLMSVPYAIHADNGVPTGSIVPYAGTAAPAGWEICDGTQLDRVVYAKLFDVITIDYGAGDGSTTFHLPDLRGRFIRGADNFSGNDPDAASRTALNPGGNSGNNIGTLQGDAFQGHHHNIKFGGVTGNNYNLTTNSGGAGGISQGTTPSGNQISIDGPVNDGVNGTPNISSETRPRNVSVNYIIKL